MLIAAKSLTNQNTEGGPVGVRDLMVDRLKPTLSSADEVHGGHAHPHGRMDRVHVEIVMGVGHPELGCGPTKLRKWHFRKMAGKGENIGRIGWKKWWWWWTIGGNWVGLLWRLEIVIGTVAVGERRRMRGRMVGRTICSKGGRMRGSVRTIGRVWDYGRHRTIALRPCS